jgi:hypothetical protein
MFALVLFAAVAVLGLVPRPAAPRVVCRVPSRAAGSVPGGCLGFNLTFLPAGPPAGITGGGG